MRIDAIVLAAGQSRRFGPANKLTASLSGKPLIRHVVDAMLASRAGDTIVVVSPGKHDVRAALANCHVRFIEAVHGDLGMGHSIAAGISALSSETAAAVVALGDMPGATSAIVNRLCETFQATAGDAIVLPVSPDGRRGHPVLWPRLFFSELAGLAGDTGGRHLLDAHSDRIVAVPAEPGDGSFRDIDTPDDLAAWPN